MYIPQKIQPDADDAEFKLHIYDKDVNFLGTFDFDAVLVNPKYKKGDFVLFLGGDRLECGKIDAVAQDDEPYLIIHEDTNVRDCSPHDHPSELFIIKKISEEEAEEFLPRKFFYSIQQRSIQMALIPAPKVKNNSLKEAGEKYLDFVKPSLKNSSTKTSDSKDLKAKPNIK